MEIKSADILRYEKDNNIKFDKDKNSEEAVIGSILTNPMFKFKVESFLKSRMFYDRKLGCIYHVVDMLQNEGVENIDTFMIETKILSNKGFKDLFSKESDLKEYFEKLMLSARSDVKDVEFLAKNITTQAFKRESYIKLQELSKEVLNSDEDINKINYDLQCNITSFADTYVVDESVSSIGEKLDELWESIELDRKQGYAGLPSFSPSLSSYFTYENGECVLIGGRAKSGKSMFFLQEAIHKVKNGVPVLIMDTEMNTKSWLLRCLANLSGVEIRKIKTNSGLDDEEYTRICEAKEWLRDKPLYHIYDPHWTQDKIFMTVKQLKLSRNIGFVIYDYIKQIDTSGTDTKEHNFLGDMANFLKSSIAGYFNIPVLTGGQMSPKELRLADSDKINRYVSTVAYWIHKTADEKVSDGVKEGNVKLVIHYNRNGMQHDITSEEYFNYVFDGSKAKIYEAEVFEHNGEALPY